MISRVIHNFCRTHANQIEGKDCRRSSRGTRSEGNWADDIEGALLVPFTVLDPGA